MTSMGPVGSTMGSMQPFQGDQHFMTKPHVPPEPEEIVFPTVGGPVSFGYKQWGISGSKVVPTPQTMALYHPDAHSHPHVNKPKPPVPHKVINHSELHRQEVAMQLWVDHEEDLRRRVTMLENLIRRTVDLPSFDVPGHEKSKRKQYTPSKPDEAHRRPFSDTYSGPVIGEEDTQVYDPTGKSSPESIYYQEPTKAKQQANVDQIKMAQTMGWRHRHPTTMALAGDCSYVQRNLYMEPINHAEKWEQLFWMGQSATVDNTGSIYPRLG